MQGRAGQQFPAHPSMIRKNRPDIPPAPSSSGSIFPKVELQEKIGSVRYPLFPPATPQKRLRPKRFQLMDRREAMALGSTMTAAMIMFAGFGYYLDKKYAATTPWFTLAGMFFALFFSAYEVWKIVRRQNAKDGEEDKEI